MLTLPGFLVNSMDPGAGASLRGSIATAWSALTEASLKAKLQSQLQSESVCKEKLCLCKFNSRMCLMCLCGLWNVWCGMKGNTNDKAGVVSGLRQNLALVALRRDQPGNWPWVKIFISLMLLNETKKRTQIIWTQIPKASRVLQSYSGTLAKKRENVGILNKTSLILCFPQKGPKMIWSWKPCNIW